jgi:methylated-DNA-[protein]-cysteine S-methyltransferase
MLFSIIQSQFGQLGIYTKNDCLVRILLPNKLKNINIKSSQPYSYFMKKVRLQLSQYFNGNRKSFELNTSFKLTDFHSQSLREVSKIPYAKTKSYKEIAKIIKSPKAYRAVANANAINPIPIIIPCHRVINSNGAIGGYAGGSSLKKKLLKFEKDNSKYN